MLPLPLPQFTALNVEPLLDRDMSCHTHKAQLVVALGGHSSPGNVHLKQCSSSSSTCHICVSCTAGHWYVMPSSFCFHHAVTVGRVQRLHFSGTNSQAQEATTGNTECKINERV